MNKVIPVLGLFLYLSASVLQAATVIDLHNGNERMTIVTDGQFARLNLPGDEYAIVDYKKQILKVVDPKKRQVTLLDADKIAETNKNASLRTAVRRLGSGVSIAGYPTQKYAYSANGKSCGVIYASMDVYQEQGIKELLQAVQAIIDKQRLVLGGLAAMLDDCMLADMTVTDHVKRIGVPMRTERNGRVGTEIKRIRHNVTLPADIFVIPASHQASSLQDKVKGASHGIAKLPQDVSEAQQPHVQELLRHGQPSGKMTPAMMEQMSRGQVMMRQYQQRR